MTLNVSHPQTHISSKDTATCFSPSPPREVNPPSQVLGPANMTARHQILSAPGMALFQCAPRARTSNPSRRISPTRSVYRARWHSLQKWTTLTNEAADYIWNFTPQEQYAVCHPYPEMMAFHQFEVQRTGDRFVFDEFAIQDVCKKLYANAHNIAVAGPEAADPHAHIRRYTTENDGAGKPDFLFKYNGMTCGIIEVKCFWNVTREEIDEVINNVASVSGEHHGRLAFEQLYGYLVRNAKVFGILTTGNGWVFMKRENGGRLYTTDLIPCETTLPQPTIQQMLWYLSYLAVITPDVVEKDAAGETVYVAASQYSHAGAAPRVPGPNWRDPYPYHTTRSGARFQPTIIRSRDKNTDADAPKLLFEPWIHSNKLGVKTFLATLEPGGLVVGKFWDSWKEPREDRDNEVEVYMKLQSLWGNQVPHYIGCGAYDFFWTLFIERIDGEMLSKENISTTVKKNVVEAFEAIHELGVIHGDVRRENVMVRSDESVVIIDFESGSLENVTAEMIAEEVGIVQRMLDELKGSGDVDIEGSTELTQSSGVKDLVQVGNAIGEAHASEAKAPEGWVIPEIARSVTPIISGKSPEGTDGEAEDSDTSDTDSTW